jgi:tetratricopeptide (TPR) repeat protein
MRVTLLALPALLLALHGSSDAWAGRTPEIKTSADELTIEGEGEPTPEEHAAAFNDYLSELERGQKARAADALIALIADPLGEPFHAEAYAKLGDLLTDLDLPYASLCAFAKALTLDAEAEWSPKAVDKAFALADRVGDSALLEPVFAKNVGGDVDKLTRSRMAYLAARENYRQGQYGLTLGLLRLVVDKSPHYADAKMLHGVVLNQQNRPTDALAPLIEAYQVGEDTGREPRFLNTVLLNIARSYYAAGNYPRAIEYYAKVSRESDFWLEAQFERGWAHFRLEDMNGTIALLHNHGSPFFADSYFPEGHLLRVYALFLLCKFPEATKQIEAFEQRYGPVHKEMKAAVAGLSAEDAFELARGFALEGDPGAFPEPVLRTWRSEARLLGSIDAVQHAEDELSRLRNISANPFVSEVSRWIRVRREEIVRGEGERFRDELQGATDDLAGMLSNVQISKLDMLQFETRLYEQASLTGRLSDKERRVVRTERVRKGWVYWPYQGEYWADELGYYRVNAIPECPAGLRGTQE